MKLPIEKSEYERKRDITAGEILLTLREMVAVDKEAGCEKLPEGPMRDNCEKKKEEGEENEKKEKKAARAETYALTDVRANDVDSVRIALEAAGYKVRPYQHKFHGHYVAMVEVEGDPKGIAKVMSPWIRKGEAQRVKGRVEDHFKSAATRAPANVESWLRWED